MHGNNRLFHHVVSQPGRALGEVAGVLGGDLERTKKLFALGAIYLNSERLFVDTDVVPKDHLRIHAIPRRYEKPLNLEKRVLWDDPWYTIFDKPSGIPCHATVDNARENLLAWWEADLEDRTWITHRLDIGTSGCVVVAKSGEASGKFNKLILRGEVQKDYEALVTGDFQHDGTITHWMVDEQWAPRIVRDYPFEKALECRLKVLKRETLPDFRGLGAVSRLELRLETGRTHQIRAQMGLLQHPILNDGMYKGAQFDPRERWGLCARYLTFKHPFTGELMQMKARTAPEEHLMFPGDK